MTESKTTQEYNNGYDAALKDMSEEFDSYGMDNAKKFVDFRLYGPGGMTYRPEKQATQAESHPIERKER